LQVLHPLEVADRHAASVGQDIGKDFDPPLRQDLVGVRVNRAVGRFDDDRGLDAGGVLLRDDAAEGCRDEQIDVELQKLIVANPLCILNPAKSPWLSRE